MILLLASPLAMAAPWEAVVGASWTPLGRADLAWIEAGQESGTLVSGEDGLIDPGLSLHGGGRKGRVDLLGELGLAAIGTTQRTWVEEDAPPSRSASSVMGLRLGMDLRVWSRPADPEVASVRPYLQAGLQGVIPAARKADQAWTVEEQAAQDDAAATERAKIASIGARAGGGAALCWPVGACLGVRGLIELSRSAESSVSATRASTLVVLEPALIFDLAF